MSFTHRFVDRVRSTVQHARVRRLSDDEKRAILVLFYEVAKADGVLAAAEADALTKAEGDLGVTRPHLALPEAVAQLAKHPAALKLASLVVADAFFVDGDYDAAEKQFVASFQQRFGLPANPLQEAVEALRKKKLDAALDEWSRSI